MTMMFRGLLGVLFILGGCTVTLSQTVPDLTIKADVSYYNKNLIKESHDFHLNGNAADLVVNGQNWTLKRQGNATNNETLYTFALQGGQALKTGVSVNFCFDDWSTDNYVIFPSGAYKGNRFDVLDYGYPPLFKPKDYGVNRPITITNVPRLNKYGGQSGMDFNTGDLSTPALGIYFPKTKKGIWIITPQATDLGNSVLSFEERLDRTKAVFSIKAPGVRKLYYSMNKLIPSKDTSFDWQIGNKVTIRYKIFVYDHISSPGELNSKFLSIRKSYGHTAIVNQLPFSQAFHLMERQQNDWWSPKDSLYTLGGDSWNMKWQLGWVGGLMVTLPLAEIGGDSSARRSFKNYQKIITQSQASSGFFYGCGNGKAWCSDCFWNPHPDNLLLLRKDADALYYIYKYCLSMQTKDSLWQVPAAWKSPLQKLTDAFIKLWKVNHQFGQFIDITTGAIKVGGTNSAAAAISGLVLASKFGNRATCLRVAKQAARYYFKNFIEKGISCGGPGEILQNNDSESAFATLEAFMNLYEVTGEKEWLADAQQTAALCATWMVSYDYHFPPGSLFGELNMKTTGAVWASTQNKHAAPGICTASGDCLLKLYRATGNKLYLDMLQDVSHNIMQYLAREDRPIKDQQSGWINERVNLSDWEGKDKIGDIFHGNTWAQVSAMLTVAEIPGIYIIPAKREVVAFDHVEARLNAQNELIVNNPTKFDAVVRVFVDRDRSKVYKQGFISTCPTVAVKAGATSTYKIAQLR